MSIKAQLTLAVALAAGLLVFAATASAAGKYKQAHFKAEVKGVQTYLDEFHHTSTDRCDMNVDSVTNERIKFQSRKPVPLTATKIPGLKGLMLTSGTDKPLRFPTKASIKRSHSNSYSPIPEDCGGNGGGVIPRPPDCGTRTVNPWWLTVDYYAKNRIELQPEDNAGSDLFEQCGSGKWPYLLSGETFGKRSSADLPPGEVFNEEYGKIITIGKGNEMIAYPDGYTETKVKWELSLTRIKDKK